VQSIGYIPCLSLDGVARLRLGWVTLITSSIVYGEQRACYPAISVATPVAVSSACDTERNGDYDQVSLRVNKLPWPTSFPPHFTSCGQRLIQYWKFRQLSADPRRELPGRICSARPQMGTCRRWLPGQCLGDCSL
jgi:hypothetical protein